MMASVPLADAFAARFWAKVDVRQPDECWPWTGAFARGGYGFCVVGPVGSVPQYSAAHRVAYQERLGAIPDGLTLDHLCRNRACVNPAHLEPVTLYENQQRGVERRKACRRGHSYTASSTRIDRKGHRVCRKCERTEPARMRRVAVLA